MSAAWVIATICIPLVTFALVMNGLNGWEKMSDILANTAIGILSLLGMAAALTAIGLAAHL